MEIAIRRPGRKARSLGRVDRNSLPGLRRRLGRAAALGHEILVRPPDDAPLFLVPRVPRPIMEKLHPHGLGPALVVEGHQGYFDVWLRLTPSSTSGDKAKLREALIERGAWHASMDKDPWGCLAGFRPYRATPPTRRLLNRIAEVKERIVDLPAVLTRWTKRRLRQPPRSRSQDRP